ncbi:hypothetical protein VE03_10251 [Pseudogymnoascus sp. 23342-1-I1]|nr:hypothetical protein VE03_10251 [Pseudogymnoascus sp. 23342-1-I1]
MKRSLEETVDVAVAEAAENADNRREEKSHSKLTLEETIKLWPLHVLRAFVEEILRITLTQKIGLWYNAQADSGELDSGELDSGELDSGELDSGELDSGDLDSGELNSSKKRKRGDDEGDDQLTGVTNLTRKLLGVINSIKKSNIQSSQTTQMRSVSVPSLLNKVGPSANAKFTVAKFRNIIPKWCNHTTLYVNPLSLEPAGPRRIDIFGNGKAQVNVTVHGEQLKDLKDMAPSRFFESIMSHLDGGIELNMASCNGSGLMQVLIPINSIGE